MKILFTKPTSIMAIATLKRHYWLPIASMIALLSVCCLSSTAPKTAPEPLVQEGDSFKDYWYQGKAEISSYQLQQARYGELRDGKAVLVFVTEPFSKSRQVKTNANNMEDVVPILKLNAIKKFNTGIYDYSILKSVFTPVDLKKHPNSIKVSTSVQEWCGHTYTQLNLQTYKYKVRMHSYFEQEGDREYQIEQALLEDELFNLIRIDPKTLPTGTIRLIPNTATSSLRHKLPEVQEAAASLQAHDANDDLMTYRIQYSNSKRDLTIHFKKDFPYQIEGWEDSYRDGGQLLTTKATRLKTILSPYWSKSTNADEGLRQTLQLD